MVGELTTILATAFAPIRLDVDTSDPFVQFTLETNRINSTFRQVLDAIGAIQSVMTTVVKKVDSHDDDIQRVRSIFESLTARVDHHDKRFESVDSTMKALQQKQLESEKMIKDHDAKLITIEQRLKAAEQLADQIKLLSNELSLVKMDVTTLQSTTAEHSTELKTHTNQIRTVNESIAVLQKKQEGEVTKLKNVYDIFEMDEAKVRSVLAGKSPSAKDPDALSAQATYCHTLPSFAGLRNALNKDMAALEARLQEQAAAFQKKVMDDVQQLRARLGEKVDRKEYEPFVFEVREELKKTADFASQILHLQNDMKTKADRAECIDRISKLETVKADRSELLGLLRHDDVVPLENDMQELHKAFDSLCQKMNLELKEARAGGGAAQPGLTPPQTPGGSIDGSLNGRVNALEALGRWLQDNKADKKDLNEIYRMLDTPGFVRKPSTPNGTEDGLRRHGSLAPLGRPTSADKSHERRGSIPESVRPPTPPLNYTSSPIKYVPNNAKYRANATVYDSEGGRTNASVTAARAVPFEEHCRNNARHVAGESTVPCGHVHHEIPNN
jgi:predicted  nucleic acid-binding Zn-ribbon protein